MAFIPGDFLASQEDSSDVQFAVDPSDNTAAKQAQAQNYGLAAAGFSILGGLLKGMAARQAGGYNATTDRNNALLADRSAADAVQRGQFAAQVALLHAGGVVGKQKAALAAAGVVTNTGSAVNIQADALGAGDLDARIAENNAMREAWGYRTQAKNYRQKAAIDEATGDSQAGASILGGITGAATYGKKTMLSLS